MATSTPTYASIDNLMKAGPGSVLGQESQMSSATQSSKSGRSGRRPYSSNVMWHYYVTHPGKVLVFDAGLGCQVAGSICLFIAFVTPFWIQSWPRVHSGFKHIGLWQVCLAGLVLEFDPIQKSYHGCWWILSTEFKNIGAWLTPSWFVITQLIVTLCILAQLVNLVLMGLLRCQLNSGPRGTLRSRRNPTLLIQIGCCITAITAAVMTLTVVLFGVAFWADRRWLPHPHLNYPSWSYGLAVLAAFLFTFAAIPQVVYVMIVREEQRKPPPSVAQTPDTSFYKRSASVGSTTQF